MRNLDFSSCVTGFYMIGTSVMKEFEENFKPSHLFVERQISTLDLCDLPHYAILSLVIFILCTVYFPLLSK